MKHRYAAAVVGLLLCISVLSCQQKGQGIQEEPKKGGAALAMEAWALHRSYPDGKVWQRNLAQAYEQQQLAVSFRGSGPDWEALGPKNFGGRTLCLAFHPQDPNILYAGSAGGGLWKSTTAGVGTQAWERVPLGHPVIGVSSIAIDPSDPDVMYIGTGEVYNYDIATPAVYDRLTRGSYGSGLLKTTDGGLSWEKSIDWSYEEMKGIWDVVINPENPQTVFAATTEGLYRSYNAGADWELAHDFPMGIDIELHPLDTNILFVSHGGHNSPGAGVFRSLDGGDSFSLMDGLPDNYTGRSLISVSLSDPDVLYASVANSQSGIGLFRSDDGGDSWQLANSSDVASYQGWYSHDVAIKPDNPQTVIWTGIEAYKSTNGGNSILRKSSWSAWDFGQTPVGGPEGPPNYVHADIHAAYYSPHDDNAVFLATDGGIFYSGDNGETWEGRNGGYQTQQFYANFACSPTNPNLAMGGLQDNASAIYVGEDSWVRVIGGDGMGAAINPLDNDILYGSWQRLNLLRSGNGGQNFSYITPPTAQNEARNFNSPFVLEPQNPNVIYVGAQRLHRSFNEGGGWLGTSSGWVDPVFGNPILTIAVSPYDNDIIFVGTSPLLGPSSKVYRSINSGQSWQAMDGLPDRVPMDIVFHPEDENTLFVAFSGFGAPHLFKTEDGGESWSASDDGLPDLPTNAIAIDPEQPSDMYVGNDLGVYASFDAGQSWEPYSTGVAEAVMVYDLAISHSARKLRAATHGLGVYQTDLREIVSTGEQVRSGRILQQNYPNPVKDQAVFPFELPEAAQLKVQLLNSDGRLIRTLGEGRFAAGKHQMEANLGPLPAGAYAYVLEGRFQGSRQAIREVKTFVKN
ncbi:MAG: hypothetical protein KDD19_17990 [Phaeodactylibacter sp.]|nr:hypothetical protein [Phaeodactylibacter sp.]MCB9052114.1 hypothetical protein [Lewinellaceae bacterium]